MTRPKLESMPPEITEFVLDSLEDPQVVEEFQNLKDLLREKAEEWFDGLRMRQTAVRMTIDVLSRKYW